MKGRGQTWPPDTLMAFGSLISSVFLPVRKAVWPGRHLPASLFTREGISAIAKGNLGQVQYSGLRECSLKLWGMLQAWGKDIWKNSKCSSCFYGWKMAKRESVVPSNCCPWDPECWSKVKPEELTLGPFHGPYTLLPCCGLGSVLSEANERTVCVSYVQS